MIKIQSLTKRLTDSLRQRGLVDAPVRVGSRVVPPGGVAFVRGTPAELSDIERARAAGLISTSSATQREAQEVEASEDTSSTIRSASPFEAPQDPSIPSLGAPPNIEEYSQATHPTQAPPPPEEWAAPFNTPVEAVDEPEVAPVDVGVRRSKKRN